MNKKIISIVIASSIVATSIISVPTVFAKNFESKQNVALNHSWTVKFNKQLNSSQYFSKVTIKDSNGNVIPVDVIVGSDKQSVTVTPKENYSANTNYTLTVDGIKDSSGNNLRENATMQFTTVQPTQPTNNIIKPELLAGAEGRADKVWYQCFGSIKDQNGNLIPLNSYALGQVYTRDQARKFDSETERNKNWSENDSRTICGLDWSMKFFNNKLYVGKKYPINVTGLGKYDEPYYTSEMVRYTNPINPLAEQQIYNLVSNVARENDTASSKYTLSYNDQYNTYKMDNGNLVKVANSIENTTDFYLELMSQDNDASGSMAEYGKVTFLENPYTVNGINYNLKVLIDPESFPVETKILMHSIVGNKFGDDLTNEVLNKFNNKIFDNTPLIVDNVKCYINDGYVYISY